MHVHVPCRAHPLPPVHPHPPLLWCRAATCVNEALLCSLPIKPTLERQGSRAPWMRWCVRLRSHGKRAERNPIRRKDMHARTWMDAAVRGDAPVRAVMCTALATPASGEAGSQLTAPGVSVIVPSIAGAFADACSLAAACINTSSAIGGAAWPPLRRSTALPVESPSPAGQCL